MLFSPIAGVIADRFDRRLALIVNHAWLAALAIVFAMVLILGLVELWHLYLFSLLTGAGWKDLVRFAGRAFHSLAVLHRGYSSGTIR
jgi:MFS family permease